MRAKVIFGCLIVIYFLLNIVYSIDQTPAKAAGSFDPANVGFRELITGLSNPVDIANAGDGSGRLFVVEQTGRIWIIKNGALLATPFLDIQSSIKSGGEQGLLTLAFHPSYSTNGEFYVVYTAPKSGDSTGSNLVLKKFEVSAGNPDLADPGSGTVLLTIPHPTYANHNGGSLRFGPDGYLYWSTGDGGSAGDPSNNAQNLTVLLGKILRLDVDNLDTGLNYGIPASNPFFGSPNLDTRKIWAYGLRNPWRFSFDRQTGDIFIGDVGQHTREEIDFQPAASTGGENYGWRVMEGTICYNPSSGCDQSGKVLPIIDYSHSFGCSVTGGYVYRGDLYSDMQGQYFYSDICSGNLFSLQYDTVNGLTANQTISTPYGVSTFGEDEQGELYFTDYGAGTIYQMCYGSTPSPSCIPSTISGNIGLAGVTLSYTEGIVAKTATSLPDGSYSFVVPYDWSGVVTPTKTCYTFTPSDRSYSNVVADQTGEDYSYTIDAGAGCETVDVTIGGINRGTYGIPSPGSDKIAYNGLNQGPMQVASAGSTNIISATHVLFGGVSYSELMGYPTNQLTDEYIFPHYNNVAFNSQLRVSNLGAVPTTITVTLGATVIDSYTLGAGLAIRKNYAGQNGGPLRVASSATDILATTRVLYGSLSYSELMGYPTDQLTDEYIFPYYNNVALDSQLRVSNLGVVPTTITVTLGTNIIDSYTLGAGMTTRKNYAGQNGGPLRVSSSATDIISTIRALYNTNSYSELMGYPANQLVNEYWYPVYDNVSLDSQLRVSNVGAGITTITVYSGGTQIDTYSLAAGAATRKNYVGENDGPLNVVSSAEPILSTIRTLYTTTSFLSYYEMTGLPDNQLTTEYQFPWYNNFAFSSQVWMAVP